MTKSRKNQIKKHLKEYIPKLETLKLYREQLDVFKRLNDHNEVYEKELEIETLHRHSKLLNEIGLLEVGIDALNFKDDEKDKEILECIYLHGYSITKTMYQVGYSERNIMKRLEIIYRKLDKYISI